nr:DExH-box ATP-dependent RNA helicase DExH11 isoform X2 [Ipomoea batatas]
MDYLRPKYALRTQMVRSFTPSASEIDLDLNLSITIAAPSSPQIYSRRHSHRRPPQPPPSRDTPSPHAQPCTPLPHTITAGLQCSPLAAGVAPAALAAGITPACCFAVVNARSACYFAASLQEPAIENLSEDTDSKYHACKGGNMRWGGVRSGTSKHSRTGDLPQSAVKTKRPVPLEHCLFYSGELYKVCENEQFVPQGFKAAKDVFKKKNTSSAIGGTGAFHGSSSAANDRSRGQRPD